MLVKLMGGKDISGGVQLFFESNFELFPEPYLFDIMCDGMYVTCFRQSEYEFLHQKTEYVVEVTQTIGEEEFFKFEHRFDSGSKAETLAELLEANPTVTTALIEVNHFSLNDIPYKGTRVIKVHEQTEF